MYAEVRSTQQLTPTMIRVVLGGGTLDEFEMIPATDAYINARFLPENSPLTVPFEPHDVEGVSAEHRPRPRRFTIRRWDPKSREVTIDFVAHGDAGYAGTWAQRAKPGDRLQFSGPGGSFQPSFAADWHLLIGDESALGAIGASLESLPAGRRAIVFIVVDGPTHQIELPTEADVDVIWLHRDRASNHDVESLLVDAVSNAEFPVGSYDVFLHGEAGEVRAVRKHLIADRGVDPSTASISAYWRRKHTDEAWRQIKRQWTSDQAADVARVG